MRALFFAPPALGVLLVLAACGEPSDSRLLQSRVTDSMIPSAPCHRDATIEYLADGARVRIPQSSLFQIGRTDLSECGQFALTSVMEAMLDPAVMQVVIEPDEDINMPDAYLPRRRAEVVKKFFSNVGFMPMQPPVIVQPGPVPLPGSIGIILARASS